MERGRYKKYLDEDGKVEEIPRRTKKRIMMRNVYDRSAIRHTHSSEIEYIEENDQLSISSTSLENCFNHIETKMIMEIDNRVSLTSVDESTSSKENDSCDADEELNYNDQADDMSDDAEEYMYNEKISNTNCTVKDILLMVLMIYLKHNLSWSCLVDILDLINTIFGRKIIPSTKYFFKKIFTPDVTPKYHFYCKYCYLLVENLDFTICENCGSNVNINKNSGTNFFITLPIQSQIEEVLLRSQNDIILSNSQNKNDGKIKDVFDGSLYKKIESDCTSMISLLFNTDGVNIFKSKNKSSFRPIQFSINELPKSIRFNIKNIVVCGFWFGEKPVMEIFFKPFILELQKLNNRILSLRNNFLYQINALLCTVDTPAKDKLQCKKGFNGYNACSYCYHPGTKINKNSIRYTVIADQQIQRRSHSSTLKDMEIGYTSGTYFNGFKSFSPLIGLPDFDITDGVVIDYMHCVLLGVVRQMLDLWLDSENHPTHYYIGRKIKNIDNILLKLKPTQAMTRAPRSVTEKCNWKANEFRNWLLYFGLPSLHNNLPTIYLQHFSILSNSIFTLLKSDITAEELKTTKANLEKFVCDFQNLYGEICMTYNIHLLTHLADCVKKCGPLWAYSNFHFESNNGVLKNFVKGTKDVNKQIVTKYSFSKLLDGKKMKTSDIVKDFETRLIIRKCGTLNAEIVLGNPKTYKLADTEKAEFFKYGIKETIDSYSRINYENQIFSSKLYTEKFKYDDSLIELKDGSFALIKYIFKLNGNVYLAVDVQCINFSDVHFIKSCNHFYHIQESHSSFKIIEIFDINEKCIFLDIGSIKIISKIPNFVEKD